MDETDSVSLLIWGRKALFIDPLTRPGSKKFSYSLPTYEALKEILEVCCGRPTLRWVIDKVRILKPIRMQSDGMRAAGPGGGPLSIRTYLTDVAYQIKAHFEHIPSRMETVGSREKDGGFLGENRISECDGHAEIFLGDRECCGYARPCVFGEGEGAYDNVDEMNFGPMVHSIDSPDETGRNVWSVHLWQPKMYFGVISFPRPEDCTVVETIRSEETAGL
ncbi:MAG TPA: type I-C CRISPR-associated protein Cas5c [Oscillospiraceae bacterium]|nr:type I-C CRISPR-associated protein Cas5c [Oscillospiraceae bacterium]HXK77585.1 type I-C CRISPR-associated protein Cas5c [Oscillospiraceae bacterium]